MKHWYVKELSKLTNISVRSLHHYDEIGLLRPSIRRPNGYRLYTETDLVRLQQILALKFFGFDLKQIQRLLNQSTNIASHLKAQSELLGLKAEKLLEAQKIVQKAIQDYELSNDVKWENILNLIKVFQMTERYKDTWAGKALSSEELKDFARFEESLQSRYTEGDKKKSEEFWAKMIQKIQRNLTQDPGSPIGLEIAEETMKWVNALYGKEFAMLRKAVWEKGFKGGHIGQEFGMTLEIVEWLDKAYDALYAHKCRNICKRIGQEPDATLQKEWNALVLEICGDSNEMKQELYNKALDATKTFPNTQAWLKKQQNQT